MGDADPQKIETSIARSENKQNMEHVMGFGIQNATVIRNAKKNEHMYNDYSYHVNGPVVH